MENRKIYFNHSKNTQFLENINLFTVFYNNADQFSFKIAYFVSLLKAHEQCSNSILPNCGWNKNQHRFDGWNWMTEWVYKTRNKVFTWTENALTAKMRNNS